MKINLFGITTKRVRVKPEYDWEPERKQAGFPNSCTNLGGRASEESSLAFIPAETGTETG